MNPGGRGYSEPRLQYCTPAWAIEHDSVLKKKRESTRLYLGEKRERRKRKKKEEGRKRGPGAVAQACNPSTFGGGQEIETILVNMVKPRLY